MTETKKKRLLDGVSTDEEPPLKRPRFGFATKQPPSAVPKLADLAFAFGVKCLATAGAPRSLLEGEFVDPRTVSVLEKTAFSELLGAFSTQEFVATQGVLQVVPKMAAAVRSFSEQKAVTIANEALELFASTEKDIEALPEPAFPPAVPGTLGEVMAIFDDIDLTSEDLQADLAGVLEDVRSRQIAFSALSKEVLEGLGGWPMELDDGLNRDAGELDEASAAARLSLFPYRRDLDDVPALLGCHFPGCAAPTMGRVGLCPTHMQRDRRLHLLFVADAFRACDVARLFAAGEAKENKVQFEAGQVIDYLSGTKLFGTSPQGQGHAVEVRAGTWIWATPRDSLAAAAGASTAFAGGNAKFEFATFEDKQVVALIALTDIKSGEEILYSP